MKRFRGQPFVLGTLAVLALMVVRATADDPTQTAVLRGNDPVLLTLGEEGPGDEKLAVDHGKYHYLFMNTRTQGLFKANPARYAVQMEGKCPVTPDDQGAPDLFALHKKKIYLFHNEACRKTFRADPEKYVKSKP